MVCLNLHKTDDREAVSGCVFAIQAVCYSLSVEIRDALKKASVLASESCFIYSAASYIINWNAEEWHPLQNQFHPTFYHTCHISVVEKESSGK